MGKLYKVARKAPIIKNSFIYQKIFVVWAIKKEVKKNAKSGKLLYHKVPCKEGWGPFTFLILKLREIDFAHKLGLVPVVDISADKRTLFVDENTPKEDNAWEYYFEQPVMAFDRIEVKDMTIFSEIEYYSKTSSVNERLKRTRLLPRKYHTYFTKYVKLKPELQHEVDYWVDALGLYPKNKVLGVVIRASFVRGEMLQFKVFNDHPKVKGLDYWKQEIPLMMEKTGCDKFFLAIEDEEWCEALKKTFGDKCLTIDRDRQHFFRDGEPLEVPERPIGAKQRIADYIVETYVLSHCHSLIDGGGSQGLVASALCGNRYKYVIDAHDGKIRV